MHLGNFRFLLKYVIDDWLLLFCLFSIIGCYLFSIDKFPSYSSWTPIGILIIFCWKKRRVISICLLIAFSLLYLRIDRVYSSEEKISESISIYIEEERELEGIIDQVPISKISRNQYVVTTGLRGHPKVLVKTSIWEEYTFGMDCVLSGKFVEPKSFDGFDYKKYLNRKGIFLILENGSVNCTDRGSSFSFQSRIHWIRTTVISYVDRLLPEPESSLLIGILIGEQRLFDPIFKENLRVSGTTHIIAASGYNVNILVLIVERSLSRFFNPSIRIVISLFLVWCFVVLSGGSPSIIRAAIMISLILISSRLEIGLSIHHILVLCTTLYLYYNPYIITDLSFQLSLVSTASLIYFLPVIEGFLLGVKSWVRDLILPTLACTISTAPILMYTFGSISLIGIISNLIILPILEITMITSVFALVISSISYSLAKPLLYLLWAQLDFFERSVSFFGGFDFLVIDSIIVSPLLVALMYLFLILLVVVLGTAGDKYKYYFLD